MKKRLFLILILLLFNVISAFGANNYVEVYSYKNKFGLIQGDKKITEPIYKKLIKLKDESFIFMYKNKYGIISKTGEILVAPKYTQAQRYALRFAKLGRNGKYALFDEFGDTIIDENYQSIDILYGKMFLVCKNFKYGLIGFNGDIILVPVANDIYMPKANLLKILYDGNWYEIESKKDTLELPVDILSIQDEKNFTVTKIITNPITSAGYGIVTTGDYFIKLFSSISPSYEKTIDELVLYHGADTASILIKSGWIIKFPVVYVKNYINNVKSPNNGPLSDIKTDLKNKLK